MIRSLIKRNRMNKTLESLIKKKSMIQVALKVSMTQEILKKIIGRVAIPMINISKEVIGSKI